MISVFRVEGVTLPDEFHSEDGEKKKENQHENHCPDRWSDADIEGFHHDIELPEHREHSQDAHGPGYAEDLPKSPQKIFQMSCKLKG